MTNRFQKWALATTLATYMLIMVGGLVRASDAGLGCPDWPTCFGKPYPPLSHAELLERDIPADFDVDNFHVTLAWIEYTNRLTGSIIGLLVIGTLATALADHRKQKHILYPTIGAFVAVVVNGWMGSQVIESELDPLIITTHLLLAWVQVSLLLYATVSAFYTKVPALPQDRKMLARGAMLVLFMVLMQAGFGADLRGQLEVIEQNHPAMIRGDWIHQADWVDQVHRSFSWLVMGGVFGLGWYAHKRMAFNAYLRYATQLAGLLVVIQVAVGIGLAYAGLPPALQVIHLVNASLLVGSMTVVYLLASRLPVEDDQTTSQQTPVGNLQTAGN